MKYKNYSKEDKQAREDYISSRSDIIHKSDAVDLWIKVISKAKDDIIFYSVLETKQELKEEEKNIKESAESFLFDNEHRIPYDDYIITLLCPECNINSNTYMSNLASGIEMCPNCSAQLNLDEISYSITKVKTISLKELLLIIWNIEDIDMFRNNMKIEIDKRIKSKLNG